MEGTLDHPLAVTVGRNVKVAREAMGFSQEDLQYASGVHRTSIGSIERGKVVPSVATLLVLCKALDCGLGDLASGVTWDPGPDVALKLRCNGFWLTDASPPEPAGLGQGRPA